MGTIELDHPMQRAMDLAWESFCAGSLGIGAVVTQGRSIVATGRNRLAEVDSGDDPLAGTSLAHAEVNALAKLRWGAHPGGVELWTTLEPCLQCLGAIRLSAVTEVHVLAPDPLFVGVRNARELNQFIGSRWPLFVESEINEWAVLSLLFHTHVTTFWQAPVPGWNESLPSIASLATDLVDTGELLRLAERSAPLLEVADQLWPRLNECLPDVVAIADDAFSSCRLGRSPRSGSGA